MVYFARISGAHTHYYLEDVRVKSNLEKCTLLITHLPLFPTTYNCGIGNLKFWKVRLKFSQKTSLTMSKARKLTGRSIRMRSFC